MTAESQQEHQPDPALDAAYRLAEKLVNVLRFIIVVAFLLIIALVVAYVWLVVNPSQEPSAGMAAAKLETTLFNVWDKVIPIGLAIIKLVAPIVVLLLALVLLRILGRSGAAPFDLGKITSDLPSVLALLIIITICFLPIAGFSVPDVLNNIALVVVGFYFGKRDPSKP